jgi:hypothetical protein
LGLTEADKFKRIYLDYTTERSGQASADGLRRFGFRADTGYRSEDLFVGDGPKGLVVMRCVRASREVPSPGCLRELLVDRGVALSYRFKRTHLGEWRSIAVNVDSLLATFAKHPK